MNKIQEFAAKQQEFNARIATAVDGLSGDVKTLKDKIDELQGTTGVLSPEDQALLDQISAQTELVAQKLEALDALTPPVEPPADPA